ncbi:MAG: hypothetical protein VKP62_14545 [Candidatus Sericytochromatia bacterium]|nr:hypothetical protein [Candidatus Sericytochromatia bacterium]
MRMTRVLLFSATLSAMFASSACDRLQALAPLLPELLVCGAPVLPQEMARLGEGPALFVDAVRVLTAEVARQTRQLSSALQGGVRLDGQVFEALGPYAWQGQGTYQREAADDRVYRLRLYWGEGHAGKAVDQPLEAELTRLDSYVPDLLALINPAGVRGPLFPLLQPTPLPGGGWGFRDEALRLDVGTVLKTTTQGFTLQLALGSTRQTLGALARQIASRRLPLSLEDTAMTHVGRGFKLGIKRFGVTVSLDDGAVTPQGDYLFEAQHGPVRFWGAVTTAAEGPRVSLRCSEAEDGEFASLTWRDGKAHMAWKGGSSAFSLPGLAKLRAGL